MRMGKRRSRSAKPLVLEAPITHESEIPPEGVAAYRLGLFMAGRFNAAVCIPPPERLPLDFRKAAALNPALHEELHRLVSALSSSDLIALAHALLDVCAGRPGARPLGVSVDAELKAKAWGTRIAWQTQQSNAGRHSTECRSMMRDALNEVMPLLTESASDGAKRKRAQKLIDWFAKVPPLDTRVSATCARAILAARANEDI